MTEKLLLTALKAAADELERYVQLQTIFDYIEYAAQTQKILDGVNNVIAKAETSACNLCERPWSEHRPAPWYGKIVNSECPLPIYECAFCKQTYHTAEIRNQHQDVCFLVPYIMQPNTGATPDNRSAPKSAEPDLGGTGLVDCPMCEGNGFSGYGSGYGDVCGECGGAKQIVMGGAGASKV